MRYFEVGYDYNDGVFSVNIITATGENALQKAQETACKHAERFSVIVTYLKETTEAEALYKARKGMPMYSADGEEDA